MKSLKFLVRVFAVLVWTLFAVVVTTANLQYIIPYMVSMIAASANTVSLADFSFVSMVICPSLAATLLAVIAEVIILKKSFAMVGTLDKYVMLWYSKHDKKQ